MNVFTKANFFFQYKGKLGQDIAEIYQSMIFEVVVGKGQSSLRGRLVSLKGSFRGRNH